MIEVRWHGRGGQGSFTVARLLGLAAAVFEGKYALAFPSFGPERRGAPVLGFTRIDDQPIKDRSEVKECDYAVVLDPSLITNGVTDGLKSDSVLVVNCKDSEKLSQLSNFKVVTIDATSLALDILGRPITNTAMLGALIAASGIIKLDSTVKAVERNFPAAIVPKNVAILKESYRMVKEG